MDEVGDGERVGSWTDGNDACKPRKCAVILGLIWRGQILRLDMHSDDGGTCEVLVLREQWLRLHGVRLWGGLLLRIHQ